MSTGVRCALTVLAVGLLAVGCAGADDVTEPGAGPGEPTATPSAAATGAVPADLLDEAVAAAAQQAGVSTDEVEVVRAEQVQWSSSALGCPEEGQMYTQVITDGYWVVLGAGDEELDYRAAVDGPLRLCEGGGDPPVDAGGA